jgi:hypothetical protein
MCADIRLSESSFFDLPSLPYDIKKKYQGDNAMKVRLVFCPLLFCLSLLFVVSPAIYAADYPKEPVTIKLDGAKMPPVTFSHATHVEKVKVECAKCHHKDAQNPKACTTCHGATAKDSRPAAKDAFHTRCQTCHKEMAAKGITAPTKCTECHKK